MTTLQATDCFSPPTAECSALVNMIGPEAALTLIEHLGGSRLYVAANDQSRSFIHLAEIIGREAADKLRTAMGRDYLKVPLAKSWRIQIYRERGMSYAAIANILSVSQNTVWRVLEKSGMTKDQHFPQGQRAGVVTARNKDQRQ